MICIIILLLCTRDLRKKYDSSQCIYHYFRSSLAFFFLSQGERDLHFLLGFVEEKKAFARWLFPVGFPGVELLCLHDLFIDSLLVKRLPTEKP